MTIEEKMYDRVGIIVLEQDDNTKKPMYGVIKSRYIVKNFNNKFFVKTDDYSLADRIAQGVNRYLGSLEAYPGQSEVEIFKIKEGEHDVFYLYRVTGKDADKRLEYISHFTYSGILGFIKNAIDIYTVLERSSYVQRTDAENVPLGMHMTVTGDGEDN